MIDDEASSELPAADVCRGRRDCVDEDEGDEAFTPCRPTLGPLRKAGSLEANSHLILRDDSVIFFAHNSIPWPATSSSSGSASTLRKTRPLGFAVCLLSSGTPDGVWFYRGLLTRDLPPHSLYSSHERGLVGNWFSNTSSLARTRISCSLPC